MLFSIEKIARLYNQLYYVKISLTTQKIKIVVVCPWNYFPFVTAAFCTEFNQPLALVTPADYWFLWIVIWSHYYYNWLCFFTTELIIFQDVCPLFCQGLIPYLTIINERYNVNLICIITHIYWILPPGFMKIIASQHFWGNLADRQ